MKTNIIRLAAGAALLVSSASASAAPPTDDPIITFHTNLYELAGSANGFTFYLGASENTYIDVDCGFGPIETELEMAYFDPDSSKIQGTPITCTVSAEGIVKIYGDASKIDYIDMEGCYITSIEWPQLTEVEILNLDHNQFAGLDLSHMTKLQALYVNDNPFSEETPLIVGANKPDLTILELSMIEWLDPNFNLTGYPSLRSLTAYSTPTLRNVDTSNCPALLQLSVDATGVEKVDVSANPSLLILNVSETRVSSLDLSNNPLLTELYLQHEGSFNTDYKLTSLDVSKNPELIRLYLAGNRISELDLSNNKKLQSFNCRNNRIGALDFTGMDALYLVDVSKNQMNFNTCPPPQATYYEYNYAQNAMSVQRSYKEGDVLDLISAVICPDSKTEAALYGMNSENPSSQTILGDDYWAFEEGKITLKKAYADSVYVAFKNTLFPDWTLTTTPFRIKTEADFGKPSAAVKAGTSILAKQQAFYVGVAGATAEAPVTFYVDFGNGTLVDFTATSSTLPAEPNVTGARAGATTTIYMPEGADLTALKIEGMRLNSLDVTAATAIKELDVTGCNLPSVDLRWNRYLTRLDLSDNMLSAIDLGAPNSDFLKTMLGDIKLNNNRISSMTLVDNYGLRKLDVSNNRITEIDLVHAVHLTDLNIANNLISEILLSDCEMLVNLDMSDNLISEVIIPDYVPLQNFNIAGNRFTLATLPEPGFCPNYVYAPQGVISIPTKAPSINLSAQNVTVGGNSTVFTWYMADDNTPVTEGIRANAGRFVFENPNIGDIYCSMTNASFPQLTGENALRTSVVATAEVPDNVFASFVTSDTREASMSLAGVSDGTTIYIDWTGNGDLEQYILASSYTQFPVQTVANAQVKCYSYEENDGVTVFSLYGIPMKSMDATGMKSVIMFGISGAFIPDGQLKMPTAPSLAELALDNNGLTSVSFEGFPNLKSIRLNNNKLTSIDLSSLKQLETAYIADNELESVTFDNPKLWEAALVGNNLEELDLTGAPDMTQLWLSQNKLTHLDVTPARKLVVLTIDNNCFDMATLPRPSSSFLVYQYANQAPLPIEVEKGTVDLSAQAQVGDVNTVYTWYIDTPYFDYNNELVGEDLIEGEEYTLENGVTTFIKSFSHIMCVMTNAVFPSLYLYTDFINVEVSDVDSVSAESTFSVTVNGERIIVRSSDADGTPVALIDADGRIVARGSMSDGACELGAAIRGAAVVAVGNRAAKVFVK